MKTQFAYDTLRFPMIDYSLWTSIVKEANNLKRVYSDNDLCVRQNTQTHYIRLLKIMIDIV